jgi:hypothetical protein
MKWASFIGQAVSVDQSDGLEYKTINDWTYYSCQSYSLAINEGVLRYITLLPGSQLPFGLSWTENNVKIVSRFGEPDKKTSSKALGIEITYERFGLSLEFLNFDWNDMDNRLKSVILFEPLSPDDFQVTQTIKFCSRCKRSASFRCGKCKLFNYCSRECQVVHWSTHKSYCKSITN